MKDHPKTLQLRKYYFQKYDYWTRYDEGIRMDRESWYSCTPERIAEKIAMRCHDFYKTKDGTKSVLIDAYCGTGSNAIQFALAGFDLVIAIDINKKKILMAKWNSHVYGVRNKIEFIVSDVSEALKLLERRFYASSVETIKAVFMSPPWGGPAYANRPVFSVQEVPDILTTIELVRRLSHNIVLYLPRNICLRGTMCMCTQSDEMTYCVEYFTPCERKVKATAVYFWKSSSGDDGFSEKISLGLINLEVTRYIQEKAHRAQAPRKM